jgi:hypothetical protein
MFFIIHAMRILQKFAPPYGVLPYPRGQPNEDVVNNQTETKGFPSGGKERPSRSPASR